MLGAFCEVVFGKVLYLRLCGGWHVLCLPNANHESVTKNADVGTKFRDECDGNRSTHFQPNQARTRRDHD